MRSSATAARYLALIVALSLSSGCAHTVPLTTTSPEAAALVGRWTGSWRSGGVSARFTLQIARGSGDRLTATAAWFGLPTVRREFTGTLANDQLIFGDPKMDISRKELLIRAFARAIRDLVEYIPGPDMGTDERCMAWIKDEIGRAVGLPPEIGGIPLDEIGATGLGLKASVEAAMKIFSFDLKRARVVVQAYGSVGKHAARFLDE